MAVTNGQPANQDTFNNAFVSKTVDSTMAAILALADVDAASGTSVTNAQTEFNAINSFIGGTINSLKDYLPTWTNNDVGASSDSLKARAEALTLSFNEASGHNHDGSAGNGGPISAGSLADFNNFVANWQEVTFDGATGTSDDVSTPFAAKSSGGAASTIGVITDAPNNRVMIVDKVTGEQIETAEGLTIYGRLTESGGTWTLTYYSISGGTESSATLPTTDIRIFFLEVFTRANEPTIPSNPFLFGKLDVVSDIPDASASQRGLVSTGAQSWAGLKTFNNGAIISTDLTAQGELNFSLTNDTGPTGAAATVSRPSTPILALSNASLTSITGIGAPSSKNQVILLLNITGNAFDILNESGTASEQIFTGTGGNISLANGASVFIYYDFPNSIWRIAGGSGGGGSGGGFANFVTESYTFGAPEVFENDFKEFECGPDDSSGFKVVVKVPSTYVAGTKLEMDFDWSSPSTTGNIVWRVDVQLFRPTSALRDTDTASDIFSNTTAVDGTANEIQTETLDLTTADGQVTSTPLAAGDLLVLKVVREASNASDTATGNAYAIANSIQVRTA